MGKSIPRDRGMDNTVKALKKGYTYIPELRERLNSNDIVATRVLGGKKTVIISGKDAAELFYDNDKIERQGTLPPRVVKTLFGKGAIHTTTGKTHIDRKALFMSIMTEENLSYLRELTRLEWYYNTTRMSHMDEVNVYKEAIYVLTKVGIKWAGLHASEDEINQYAEDMDTMIDSFKAIGTMFKGYKEARKARDRVETWLEAQIQGVRDGEITPPEGTALYEFAHWKDYEGNPMDARLAAIDLMNVIRPLVAINRFVAFGTLAMYEFPKERTKVAQNEDDYVYKFIQEVRRFYPFVPYLPGKAGKDIEFRGYEIKKDTFMVLDVYGTLHREDLWENADQFIPERFEDWDGSPFDLIPQGGGDYYTNHRCAGEWMTVIIMEESMKYFAQAIKYEVPAQDLTVDLNKLPGRVKSGFIIKNVERDINRF